MRWRAREREPIIGVKGPNPCSVVEKWRWGKAPLKLKISYGSRIDENPAFEICLWKYAYENFNPPNLSGKGEGAPLIRIRKEPRALTKIRRKITYMAPTEWNMHLVDRKKAENVGENSPKIQGGPVLELKLCHGFRIPWYQNFPLNPLGAEKLWVKILNLILNIPQTGGPPPLTLYFSKPPKGRYKGRNLCVSNLRDNKVTSL